MKALEEAQAYPNAFFVLVDDGSGDGTIHELAKINLPHKKTILHRSNEGLRHTVIDFFEWVKSLEGSAIGFDFISIIGNDVLMPKNWLNDILSVFLKSDAEVLSPNYLPSNPAFVQGEPDVEGKGYRPARGIVGLWTMYSHLIEDIEFERHNLYGIKGCQNLLQQIQLEKEPKIGWVPDVVAQDIGHWSGAHPDHIKTEEHYQYYQKVGRNVTWA